MLRIALIDILMFCLPFLVYGAYMLVAKRADPAGIWLEAPIFWLLVVGCGLVLVTMVTLVSFSGGEPGGTYRPPSIVDGVIKPGTID